MQIVFNQTIICFNWQCTERKELQCKLFLDVIKYNNINQTVLLQGNLVTQASAHQASLWERGRTLVNHLCEDNNAIHAINIEVKPVLMELDTHTKFYLCE